MQVRSRSHKLLALVVPLTAGLAASAGAEEREAAPQQTISSDKEDHATGDTVKLAGSNWRPGETVHVAVEDDQGDPWGRDVDVVAAEDGAISDGFFLPANPMDLFFVTATGDSGTATTSFTDGTVGVRNSVDTPANATLDYKLESFNASNCMRDSRADDKMSGKGNMGSDTMSGGQKADRASGGYGTDELFGDAGGDHLNGGTGDDTVFAADGQLDSISCGLGEGDVAFVDQADLDAEGNNMQDSIRLTSCETINEPVIEEPPVETVSVQ